jgi:Cytidylate kinase-like family
VIDYHNCIPTRHVVLVWPLTPYLFPDILRPQKIGSIIKERNGHDCGRAGLLKISSLLQGQMAIITISRGSFGRGDEVAPKVAQRLGYTMVSHEVISEASRKFQVSVNKLEQAIHSAPSLLERFFSEKHKYVAYMAAATLAHFKNDNIVYDGLAGQFFASSISPMTAKILAYFKKDNVVYNGFAERYYARTISHLLNVRMTANLEDRLRLLMKEKNLGRGQAMRVLKRQDHQRNAWSRYFYGVDNTDDELYDLVIHISKMRVDDAADVICETVAKPRFKTSFESQQAIEDLALAAEIKAALYYEYPGCEVVAERKSVEIYARFTVHTDTMIADKIKAKVLKMNGVSSVTVILIPSVVFT